MKVLPEDEAPKRPVGLTEKIARVGVILWIGVTIPIVAVTCDEDFHPYNDVVREERKR